MKGQYRRLEFVHLKIPQLLTYFLKAKQAVPDSFGENGLNPK